MTPYEYLKKKVVSVIKPSSLGGVGFFAVRDIEVGENVFEPWYGEDGLYHITQEELFTLPEDLQKNIRGAFYDRLFSFDENENIAPLKRDYGKLFFPLKNGFHWVYVYPGMFINSGLKNANVDTETTKYGKVIRTIKTGEEILGNYGAEFKSIPKNFI